MENLEIDKDKFVIVVMGIAILLLSYGFYQIGYKNGAEMVKEFYGPYIENYCTCWDSKFQQLEKENGVNYYGSLNLSKLNIT